jgi:hypothetical protein
VSLQLDNWWLVVFLFILMIPQLVSIAKLVVTRFYPQT